jgi:hypothetical protein
MNAADFQEALDTLTGAQFEAFVADLLRNAGNFSSVVLVGQRGHPDLGYDIEAREPRPTGGERRWLVQVKKTKLAGADLVNYLSAIAHRIGADGIVLVISGLLSNAARERALEAGYIVWDATDLLRKASPDLLRRYFGSPISSERPSNDSAAKADAFVAGYRALDPGRDSWVSYQRLVADALEFLFCPPLQPPRYELSDADKRNRRDIIFENGAPSGWWAQARSTYAAHYIVVDAKNYEEALDKQPVLDVAHYLKSYGCGLFALLASRRGAGPAAQHATREQWIGAGKMIVHLSDAELKEMLEMKRDGGDPAEVIRRLVADFRMAL